MKETINVPLVSIRNTYMTPSYTACELKRSKLKILEQTDDKQLIYFFLKPHISVQVCDNSILLHSGLNPV